MKPGLVVKGPVFVTIWKLFACDELETILLQLSGGLAHLSQHLIAMLIQSPPLHFGRLKLTTCLPIRESFPQDYSYVGSLAMLDLVHMIPGVASI